MTSVNGNRKLHTLSEAAGVEEMAVRRRAPGVRGRTHGMKRDHRLDALGPFAACTAPCCRFVPPAAPHGTGRGLLPPQTVWGRTTFRR